MPETQSYERHTYHPKLIYIANVFMLATLFCIVAGWMGRDTTYWGLFFLLLAVMMTVLTGQSSGFREAGQGDASGGSGFEVCWLARSTPA